MCSGAVPGIDAAAHIGAIDGNGATLAVLANPVKTGLKGHEWPSRLLQTAILQNGAFLSEYSRSMRVGSPAFNERLLQRDRVISGLSDLFLVFECRANSATIDTAVRAKLQGKTVIAIQTHMSEERLGEYQVSDQGLGEALSYGTSSPQAIVSEILENLPDRDPG